MTQPNLLMEGVELMLFGMGSVLLFLTLLVYSIRGMSLLIARFAPEPLATAPIVRAPSAPKAEVSADLIIAIQAAVHQHRAKRR